MRLLSAAYGNDVVRIGAVAPRAHANRVEYAHAGVREWYANGPLGLEQGFTIQGRRSATPSLTLALALSGDLRASLSRGGSSLVLSHAGAPALRIRALSARDATGRSLNSSFAIRGDSALIRVDTAGARFPVRIDPMIESAPLPAPSDEQGEGQLGFSVALSADGSTALVGAPRDGAAAGAAWVFTRSGSTWTQQGPKLTGVSEEPCHEGEGECGFGRSVALSGDGNTALIGAPRANGHAGTAWVFTRSAGHWTQFGGQLTSGIESAGSSFGRSVALSSDGQTALVGAPTYNGDIGAVWSFTRSASGFVQQANLTGGEELGGGHFGRSVALSATGDVALVGAPGDDEHTGAAWAFARSGAGWSEEGGKLTGGAELQSGGRFGWSVALSASGDTALIGAIADDNQTGSAWVLTHGASGWEQQGPKLTAGDELGEARFGYSTALSADGDTALIGGPRDDGSAGGAWRFTRAGTTWTQQEIERPEGPQAPARAAAFGASVALAANSGSTLLGGPAGEGRAGSVFGYFGLPLSAPHVSAIEPSSGPATGGTPVTILGSGFLAGATVTIGTPATSVEVLSENEITAVTAPAPAETFEVSVSDLDGTSSGGADYTFLAGTSTPTTTTTSTVSSSTPAGASGAGTPSPRSGVLASILAQLPAPKLGQTGNVLRLTGTVRIKLPGASHFTLLTSAEQIPFGSIIDARHGRVSVTTATPGGGTQTMVFFEGEFALTQGPDGSSLATLVGGDLASCKTTKRRGHGAAASAARAKRPVRKLWAEGHGSYSTKGSYATGAVLGTRWLTEDFCEGTLIRVATDRVRVTNLVTHRRLTVTAGHSYLAKAPRHGH